MSGVSEFPSILLQASVAFSTSVKKQEKKLNYATHLHFHLQSNHKQLRRNTKRKWHKLICINTSVRYFNTPTDGDRTTSTSNSSSCAERNLSQTANHIKFFLPGSWGSLNIKCQVFPMSDYKKCHKNTNGGRDIRSLTGIAGSNPAEGHWYLSFVSVVLSGRRLCVGPISRPGEYYWLCVCVCVFVSVCVSVCLSVCLSVTKSDQLQQ